MATTIPPVSTTTPSTSGTASSSTLNAMSGSDFLNLMIDQLQHQDPLNPTDSNQLLTQLSQISTLQSNTAMSTSLGNLTLQQSIGAGGNLIGKTVKGLTAAGDEITGTVTSVTVQDKNVYLQMDSGQQLPLANVENIAQAAPATAATAGSLAAALPQLQALLGSSGGSAANLQSLLSLLGGA